MDATTQVKMHPSNIIQAVDTAPGDRYYGKKLARAEAEAKAIIEKVQMQLVNAHLKRQDIKVAQKRGAKRKREDFYEESDEEPPQKGCRFIDDEAGDAESGEELESVWETNTPFFCHGALLPDGGC